METEITPLIVKKTYRKKTRLYVWGTLFVIPELIIFILFLWVPIFKGIYYSFFHIDLVSPNVWVGLQNYVDVIHSSDFFPAIINTLYYMALCIAIGYWVPILIAIAISELKWFQGLARVIVYLPSIVPAIVLYGMWMWFYDYIGPINSFLALLDIPKIDFFSKSMAMISVVIAETWQYLGGSAIIYLAGIVNIPKDLYEAAEIDGASVWERIRHITLPSIKNLLLLMLVLQLIGTSQGFQAQMTMMGGGPDNATLTYMLLITREAFINFDYGKATALGALMFFVLIGLSLIYMKLQRRGEVHE
ncbi:MAG: sugar transporter permease [Bacilli bacterium]|nr:sugar transporter permease [Bacilli bacterium]